jgi:hypothetical protein
MNQQADGTISRFFTLPMKRRTVMIGFFLPAVLYTLGLVIPNLLWMNLIYPEKFVLSAKTIFEIQLICFSIMTFTWWFANSAIVFLHTRYTKVDLAVGLLGLIPVVAILLLTFFFSNAFYQFVKSHSDLIHTLGVTPLPFYLLLNLIYMRR